MNYSIAIVGTRDTVLGFKALGLDAVSVTNPAHTADIVEKLANTQEQHPERPAETKPKYAVIFILEELAQEIPEDRYKKIASRPFPAIIPLPGPKGATGFGERRLRDLVIQAVGTEI